MCHITKKFLAILCTAVLLASVVGCGSNPAPADSSSAPAADSSDAAPADSSASSEASVSEAPVATPDHNLADFQFSVNGTVIKLPIKFSELEALGFAPDEKFEETCQPDGMGLLLRIRKDGYPLYATLMVVGSEPANYKDTYVNSLNSYETYSDDGGEAEVILPNGLKLWESTKDDALKLYGEPTKRRDTAMEEHFEYEIEGLGRYELSFRDSGKFCGFTMNVDEPLA